MRFHSIRGWKYQLQEPERCQTALRVSAESPVMLEPPGGFAYLFPDGSLRACAGFQWDGPSGPTIDGPTSYRASMFHDVLYRMLKAGEFDGVEVRLRGEVLTPREIRRYADGLFRRHLLEDGHGFYRSWLWWAAVRLSPWAAGQRFAWANRWL